MTTPLKLTAIVNEIQNEVLKGILRIIERKQVGSLSYLVVSGPGGAETTLKLSSVISDPEALLGLCTSRPEILSDLNECLPPSLPTNNDFELSMLALGSALLSLANRLPTIVINNTT